MHGILLFGYTIGLFYQLSTDELLDYLQYLAPSSNATMHNCVHGYKEVQLLGQRVYTFVILNGVDKSPRVSLEPTCISTALATDLLFLSVATWQVSWCSLNFIIHYRALLTVNITVLFLTSVRCPLSLPVKPDAIFWDYF